MSDLDDEARSLFDAARAGYEPNVADRKRVLGGVLLRAGVVVGVTSAASAGAAVGAPLASAAASSGVAGLALKGALCLALVGSLGVGGYAISHTGPSEVRAPATSAHAPAGGHSTSDLSGAAPAAARPVAVTADAQVSGSAQSSDEARPKPPRPSSAPREGNPRSLASAPSIPSENGAALRATETLPSAGVAFTNEAPSEPPRTPAASASALTLSVEARGLAEVQSALKEGRNAEALRLVEEQRQQFAHGELEPERDAAKIVALCAVGRVADARAAARTFLAKAPRSPFAARIRASCAGQ